MEIMVQHNIGLSASSFIKIRKAEAIIYGQSCT